MGKSIRLVLLLSTPHIRRRRQTFYVRSIKKLCIAYKQSDNKTRSFCNVEYVKIEWIFGQGKAISLAFTLNLSIFSERKKFFLKLSATTDQKRVSVAEAFQFSKLSHNFSQENLNFPFASSETFYHCMKLIEKTRTTWCLESLSAERK